MAQVDFGELEYHGIVDLAFDEAESGVSGHDYGELEDHGLVPLAYAVESGDAISYYMHSMC